MKKLNRIMVGIVCAVGGAFGTFTFIHGLLAQQDPKCAAFDFKVGLAMFTIVFAVLAVSEPFIRGDDE